MKKGKIFALLAAVVMFTSCGGGGSSGGGLPTSRVEMLYQLTMSGTPVLEFLQPFLEYLGNNCPSTNLSVSLTDIPCPDGGTWSYTGTVNCTLTQNANTITVRITSTTGSSLNLNACVTQLFDIDTNGDGTADTTNVQLTGNVSPFAFSSTTIVAVFAGDPMTTEPTSVTINGASNMTYMNMQLGGDFTATLSFDEDFTFTNFELMQESNPPTCASNVVNATENSQSGTCTIQSNCFNCQ